MPSWSAFNPVVSKETLSQKIVGFLPVIPSPVTDHQTVYTALKNFQDILKQLSQAHLAVTCDGCLGKYLRNNGAESICIVNSVFEPNVRSLVCTCWDTLCKVFQRYNFVL